MGAPRQPHRRARAADRARGRRLARLRLVGEPARRPNPGAAFEAAVALAESGKQAEAQAAFSKLAKEGSSGYRMLARFREAAELAKTDPAAAVKAYDSLAADSGLGRSAAGSRRHPRRADPGRHRDARGARRAARAADRGGPSVPPHRARAARARRLARRRCGGRQALVRPDRDRRRNARRHAPAHRGADDAVRRPRPRPEGAVRCAQSSRSLLCSAGSRFRAATRSIRSTSSRTGTS